MRPVPRRLSNTCRAYEPAARCASPRPPGGCLYIPANCSSVSPAQSVDFNLRVRGRRLETATGTLRIRSCEDERTSGMSGAWRDDFLYQSDDLGGWTGRHVWPAGEVLARLLADPAWTPHCSGKRVVELGAGTGLVGLMALALGARSVVLTDRVLGVAESNLRRKLGAEGVPHREDAHRLARADEHEEQGGRQLHASDGGPGRDDLLVLLGHSGGTSPSPGPSSIMVPAIAIGVISNVRAVRSEIILSDA
jgi:hypothetical protein